ncbi:MAG: 2-hydroxyacyl-CoA dehydratase [Candidatus Lokiarchaeota archaeon]|nr:2-hydroxyacyl-CoA dehydratase [Candidatus Lokiarchaeota archaeon]
MLSENQMENRIIPYKMLLKALSSTQELVERILPENGIPSLRIGLKYIKSVLENTIQKAREGLPIIGYHFALPAEYLSCFDCVPICIEGTSYFLATLLLGGVENYYDLIGNWGHPFHTCTSQKGTMGMTLEDLFRFDAIITPSAPCDSTCGSYGYFKYAKKFPTVIADTPFIHEKKSQIYYADEIKRSLIDIGKIINQEPDFEKLRYHVEIENQVLHKKTEIFELIKSTPSPIENMFNPVSAAATIFISGTPENLSFYDEMLNITKKRYKEKSHHGGEEHIRTIWPYMLTFFDISFCEWLDRELGLSILMDIFNYNFFEPINTKSDLNELFLGMSKKAMGFPMVKQSTDFYYPIIDDCIQMAQDYDVDCFIYTQSLACKQFGSIPTILREALKDELGIPMLIIEFDVGDARMTSIKKFKEKINLFVQTLL